MGSGVNNNLGDRAVGKAPRVLLGLPLVLLPFLLGGARPWFWSGIAGIFFAGLVWLTWSGLEPQRAGSFSKKWLIGLSLLLLYPLFQSLPLPASLLTHLNPHLMLWKVSAADVALAPSRYLSISYAPLISFISGLWWIFLAGYALLLMKALREEANLNWFYHMLFWVAGFEAFYGLLQALIPSLGVLWEAPGQGWARGTFVNHNHYAAFMGMVWPVLLAYLLSVRTAFGRHETFSSAELEQRKTMRQKNWFLGLVIGLVLLALFFSQSRAGIIGALIALTVFVAFGKKWHKKGTIVLIVGCWLVMLAYGSLMGFDEILGRFEILQKDVPSRLDIWEDTWRLIQDHWLTGVGLGTYPEAIRIYQTHWALYWDIVHAHNDYLELVADLGAPVAVAMVLLVWGYWWVCARGMVRKREAGTINKEQVEKRRVLALGALAGSAAFLCHSWVEFNWQIPANQLYFIVLLVLMKI